MATTAETLRAVRGAAREKYAWPGGYPLYLVMEDGEALCVKCARSEYRLISMGTRDKYRRGGWGVAGVDINWEDGDLFCAHCNERIESAYAEPEGVRDARP